MPYPEDLSDPGIEPRSPTLQADSLPSESQGSPMEFLLFFHYFIILLSLLLHRIVCNNLKYIYSITFTHLRTISSVSTCVNNHDNRMSKLEATSPF